MLRFGCQTYSWQMSLQKYRGQLDHIFTVIAQAGFPGIEIEVVMLGDFTTADRLTDVLQNTGLQLAALTLVECWADDRESVTEMASADAAISLTATFDDALLVLCQMPGVDRNDLRQRQARLLKCVGAIAKRADDAGVKTSFHPNSPAGSLFRTSDDYESLLAGLPSTVGFTPDLGHIAAGGMDPVSVVKQYRERVNHLHVKDIDSQGRWVPIGTGIVPVAEVGELLRRTGYQGWMVLEDESEMAERDPDAIAAHLGRYVHDVLEPLQRPRRAPLDQAGSSSDVPPGNPTWGVT